LIRDSFYLLFYFFDYVLLLLLLLLFIIIFYFEHVSFEFFLCFTGAPSAPDTASYVKMAHPSALNVTNSSSSREVGEAGYYQGTGVGGTSYDGGPYFETWYPGIQFVMAAERRRCQSECVRVTYVSCWLLAAGDRFLQLSGAVIGIGDHPLGSSSCSLS
jgi:hypothetical protein